jgi:hypothetical protein
LSNTIFIVLISVLTACISFVSVKGTLSNLTYRKKWWKIITKRGWLVIGLAVSIIGLLLWQNSINEKNASIKDAQLKTEQNNSDSIIAVKVDSNRKILFKDLSEALAKQNLKIDTITKSLYKIKDSTVTIINNNYSQVDPVLDISEKGIKFIRGELNTHTLRISYSSFNTGSSNFDITLHIIASFDIGPNQYLGSSKPLPNNLKIPAKRDFITNKEIITLNSFTKVFKVFYLYLLGSYSTIDKRKSYSIETLYKYDVEKESITLIGNEEDKKAILLSMP